MWVAFTRESLVTERLTGEAFLIANLRRKGEGKKSGDVNLRRSTCEMTCFRAGWRASARDDASGKRLSPISYEFSIRKPHITIYSPLKFYASCKDKKLINKMGAPAQPQRKRCGKSHFAWNLFSWFRALAWGSSCEEQKWQWNDNKMNEFLLSRKIIYNALSISLELKLFAI